MIKTQFKQNNLTGKVLIATPYSALNEMFSKSLIYIFNTLDSMFIIKKVLLNNIIYGFINPYIN